MDHGDLLKELRIDHAQRDDHDEHGRRWLWLVAAGVVLVALVAGAWMLFARGPVEVTAATASAPASATQNGQAVLQATGYVTAQRQATVSAQIVGTLTEVLIEEGDHVKNGQVLARLEDSAQSAQLHATEASAQAAQAQTLQTQAELRQADRDMARQNELVAQGLVSKQLAEQARTKVATLRAQLNAQRKQAKAAQAQVRVAQVNYDYTVVRAPFTGVVTQKTAQVGEIIAPAAAGGGFTRTGVGTIVDMDSLEVDVDVNESYIGRVKAGMPAEAVLDAYPDWRIPAHVIAIVPAADRGKATVKVRVALERKDARIIPDMGVRVSFLEKRAAPVGEAPKGVLVPTTAIIEHDGHPAVFVIEDGRARLRTVAPAKQLYGDLRRLPQGVSVGDRVVDRPPPTLHDGDRVRMASPRS
ncbi:efflux RND transporter periplasmic adaptor subunit [Oleiagrimonas soli]|uniref:Acriflavin resistance protein n=1 Tax=Oleiagrimonas soli TaxID=1543381 RepID=A0A099CTX8_9GAMM|nr:efflux RND transporter periplasmic adaptor subunit [Oleiagrimonas soli]KGI77131.1 acriflavin resistance protein [Oleiagrimonas soli]MBB6185324.1 RND family efflux transporter MFP subunit [Oleiagrimonas soli]